MSLISLKNKMKKKKPRFLRQDAHKLHLPQNWRRPRGMHNKMRLRKKGHRVKPDSGYRSPKEVRYKHFLDFNQITISNLSQLHKIDPKKDAIIIASSVGNKKRILILEACIKSNIKVLNIKNPSKFIEDIKKSREVSKSSVKEKEEKRKKSKEESLKKAESTEAKKENEKETEKELEKESEKKILEKETIHPKEHDMIQEKQQSKSSKTNPVRSKIPQGGDRSA